MKTTSNASFVIRKGRYNRWGVYCIPINTMVYTPAGLWTTKNNARRYAKELNDGKPEWASNR